LERSAIVAAFGSLELAHLASRRWYAAKGTTPTSAALAHAFVLADDAVLALVDLASGGDTADASTAVEHHAQQTHGERGRRRGSGARVDRYAIPFVLDEGGWREAAGGDGAWRALAAAIAEGRTVPALATHRAAGADTGQVDAALVCRPSPAFAELWADEPAAIASTDEVALGRDQSNTSVVLGGRLLLKGYRRIQPGLNPDLELTAYLTEEAGFAGVPRLAGWAEVVTRDSGAATVCLLQAFLGDADDAYERVAEFLTGLVAAPGSPSLDWATEVAAELGTLTAGLHAALATPPPDAPDLAPREASRDEIRAWRQDALRQLNLALPAVAAVDRDTARELEREASAIAARVSRFEAVATTPTVMRIHADLHLGQILVADDGYRVIDFEGEPLRTIDERRRPDSPLRDVASLLRSLDHVARSARRRAEERAGPIEHAGLDIDAWIARARERFLAAYVAGLRQAGAPFTVDLDLLDAFEVAKECYEFVYAATVLPSWLWAPRDGMRWLLAHGEGGEP
jgi:maltose alpha-D-glucosyltransferase / alpha-amylase